MQLGASGQKTELNIKVENCVSIQFMIDLARNKEYTAFTITNLDRQDANLPLAKRPKLDNDLMMIDSPYPTRHSQYSQSHHNTHHS